MDVKTPESLFFMDLPDLRELCAIKIYLNPGTLNPCIRDAQIQLCRYALIPSNLLGTLDSSDDYYFFYFLPLIIFLLLYFRHLLFLNEQIVASPNPEQFDQITIIMAVSLTYLICYWELTNMFVFKV